MMHLSGTRKAALNQLSVCPTTDLEDSISVGHKKTPLNRFNPTHRDLSDWVVIIIIFRKGSALQN